MTVSINYHTPVGNNWDHIPAVMSMKASRCGAAGETVYLTFAFGGGKETNDITVFGTPSDMDRFTRAATAFNAAMADEPKPAIDPMFRALCESDGDARAYVRAAE